MAGRLLNISNEFPNTDIWLDAMFIEDIEYALSKGIKGVTTAPSMPYTVAAKEGDLFPTLIRAAYQAHPAANESELMWNAVYQIVAERSKLLLPLYTGDGKSGLFSLQAFMFDYNNADRILQRAGDVYSLGKNMIYKIPTTAGGLKAMEQVVYRGGSVMATSCVSVAQVLAASDALMRGYNRRSAEGKDVSDIHLSCAMQLSFQDMCINKFAALENLPIDNEALKWGAIAVAKRAYAALQKQDTRVKMVVSSFRGVADLGDMTDLYLRELIGGNVIMTMPRVMLEKLDAISGDLPIKIDTPVDSAITDELVAKVPFYQKSFMEDGMTEAEFASSPAFNRMFRFFMSQHDLAATAVRDVTLPDPYATEVVMQ